MTLSMVLVILGLLIVGSGRWRCSSCSGLRSTGATNDVRRRGTMAGDLNDLVIELLEAEVRRLRADAERAKRVEREMGMALTTIRDALNVNAERKAPETGRAMARAVAALDYLRDQS